MTSTDTQPNSTDTARKSDLLDRLLSPGPMGTIALTIGLVVAVATGAEDGAGISMPLFVWLAGWAYFRHA